MHTHVICPECKTRWEPVGARPGPEKEGNMKQSREGQMTGPAHFNSTKTHPHCKGHRNSHCCFEQSTSISTDSHMCHFYSFSFLPAPVIFHLGSSPSAWKMPFRIPYSGSSIAEISPFPFIWKCHHFASILNGLLVGYGIQGWQTLPVSKLKIWTWLSSISHSCC